MQTDVTPVLGKAPFLNENPSLSLLQQILLTQELNWGLLHCRWILYQLSNQGSPMRIQH